MGVDKFYNDSLALTVSNLVTGIISFAFSIILSRKLGAEGLGLYSLVMPVYGLLLCITSEGLITALSKISAVYNEKRDYYNLNRTLSIVSVFVFAWSLFVALLTFIASSSLSAYVIRDTRCVYALRIICPALVFVPLSSILKGYLYGIGKFRIAAFADIMEKCIRVLVLLICIFVLMLDDMTSMITAAYSAIALGELTSLLILFSIFKVLRKNTVAYHSGTYPRFKPKSRIQLLFDVFVITLPLSVNGLISTILSTATTLLLPRRLTHAGFSYTVSLSLIGKFIGMAFTVVYLPYITINSMLTVLIPDISLKLSRKDIWAIESRISQVFNISILVGIGTTVICFTIPDVLGELFYNRSDLGNMIKFASAAGFTSYVASPTFGFLNALGKQHILLRNSIIISVENLVLVFLLTGISELNIWGYGICVILTSVTTFAINMYEIAKICEVRFPLTDIAMYGLTGILTYFAVSLVLPFLLALPPVLVAICTVLLTGSCIYFITYLAKEI